MEPVETLGEQVVATKLPECHWMPPSDTKLENTYCISGCCSSLLVLRSHSTLQEVCQAVTLQAHGFHRITETD